MDIAYRQFTEQDAHAVFLLAQAWFHENITYGIAPGTVEELLQLPRDFFFVAADCDTIAGYVTAEIIEDNTLNVFPLGARYLRVNDLYVAKAHRGHGIGTRLLACAEKRAAEGGIAHLFISSATKDAGAVRAFYERQGYGIWTTLFAKRTAPDVRTYDLGTLGAYRYVIVFARYHGQWLYSRHKARDTFETAGGHIEPGETPLDAAKRELYEETGALRFAIRPAFDYSVHVPTGYTNGQVFLADVSALGTLPESEMAETRLFDTIPTAMTYPHILPILFERIRTL